MPGVINQDTLQGAHLSVSTALFSLVKQSIQMSEVKCQKLQGHLGNAHSRLFGVIVVIFGQRTVVADKLLVDLSTDGV